MENAKTLILNNKDDKNFKAILNLKNNEESQIKIFHSNNISKNYALGLKQKGDVIKIPLQLKNNFCKFSLPKNFSFGDNVFCAVVDVSNIFCPEIVLTGSLNSTVENNKIESAFVASKPEDNSVLYDSLDEIDLENLIDKNLEEDLNSEYFDSCSRCKYRKAFYEEGSCFCDKNNIGVMTKIDKKIEEINEDFEAQKNHLTNKECFLNNQNSFKNSPSEDLDKTDDKILEEDKKDLVNENMGFYKQIEDQINDLFIKYPKEDFMESIIANSKWIRVDFNENRDYYVLGLIYDDTFNMVEYIAYGMPSSNNKNPPEELKDYVQWLPKNFTNKNGDGYWLVYQSAKNGETIKINFV